jgi:hypothetical protein
MTNSSFILSNLKAAVSNLEEVHAKIEQCQALDPGDNKRQSHLRAFEDLLAAQFVTTAMRYHSIVTYEWRTKAGGGLPTLGGWKKRVALALSGLRR